MDPTQNNLHAQLHLQLQQQQQLQNNMSQHQQDATPQDVLAEARKNLQVLIDSGLSKDLLHQWVDDSQSLQLSLGLATQPSLISPPPNSLSLPPPPPPQCPPPPPPTMPAAVSSASPANAATPPASTTPNSCSSNPATAANTPNIKHETLPEELTNTWSAAAPTCVLSSPGDMNDTPMFLPPSAPFSHHRPRISISSVSSGSSGHASIWSTHSAQSTMSWQSASSLPRTQAPLPMPPPNTPPAGASIMGGPHVSAANKQNIYWCTSCETSFKRKYDWKRHEDEFHERWRKYPCPEPGCNRSFWGSNSFNQHHKQCHGCKTCPHAEKVVKFLRKRKYWACGFCSALHPARERHVEHVARHFESGLTKGDWMHSRVVYGLLHQPLIHEAWDALVATKQSEYSGRRPQFSWHPSKTGRAQGFLEKENPGQLQDLLEFFSGDEGEAQWIVSVAYDLADIVLTQAPIPSPQFSPNHMSQHPFPSQDPRLSFATLPTQAHQQQLMTPPEHGQQQMMGSPFRNTIFVPSQGFPTQQPSPASSSHSPMDKGELPQPPSSAGADSVGNIMEFEFSHPPVVFEDWESLNGSIPEERTSHMNQGPQQGWPMKATRVREPLLTTGAVTD
ncbi:hypothetical protein B0I35DRAFT_515782 [Stachybotrys elegans]|uniref:C2H2-type domain-containing protein n=1 Tax=Stachybotrys elegans TaxID=80388 RepID=A0A8K0SLE7_9HYPO|nr:hypothetical protein B0I35DRAFT_515782 [Stachybotrys elegans]